MKETAKPGRIVQWTLILSGFIFCLWGLLPSDVALAPFIMVGMPFSFLVRVVPQINVNGGTVATAVLCLISLAVGLHWLLRWVCTAVRPEAVWRWRWTLGLLGLVVLVFVSGTAAIGVTHQAVWLFRSPEPLYRGGRRDISFPQTQHYLSLIEQALFQRNEAKGSFPPAGTFDDWGRGMHGWQTMLLPYIEQDSLYSRIDFRVPWDHPRNEEPFQTRVQVYESGYWDRNAEHKDARGYALTAYAGNSRVLGGDRALSFQKLRESPAGISQIILAGEAAGNYKAWGHPANWRDLSLGLNRSPDGFGSLGKNGVLFLMADGGVRTFTDDADPEFLRLLSQPDVDR